MPPRRSVRSEYAALPKGAHFGQRCSAKFPDQTHGADSTQPAQTPGTVFIIDTLDGASLRVSGPKPSGVSATPTCRGWQAFPVATGEPAAVLTVTPVRGGWVRQFPQSWRSRRGASPPHAQPEPGPGRSWLRLVGNCGTAPGPHATNDVNRLDVSEAKRVRGIDAIFSKVCRIGVIAMRPSVEDPGSSSPTSQESI